MGIREYLATIYRKPQPDPAAIANAELLRAAQNALKHGAYNYKTLQYHELAAAVRKVEEIGKN